MRGDLLDVCHVIYSRVGLNVAHAEAAAKVEDVHFLARFVLYMRNEGKHYIRRVAEGCLIEDLGAHVAMEALEGYIFLSENILYGLLCLSGLDSHSELRVLYRPDRLGVWPEWKELYQNDDQCREKS